MRPAPQPARAADLTGPGVRRLGISPALASTTVAKLTVNVGRDRYEQEADHFSEEILRMPDRQPAAHWQPTRVGESKQENQLVQLKDVGGTVSKPAEAPTIVHEVLRSPGQPLDAASRAFMEPRFCHDFSRIRVHTDEPAAESAQALRARAYTVGTHVVFGGGQFVPSTGAGRALLAHELTHVVQQGGRTTAIQRAPDVLSRTNAVKARAHAKVLAERIRKHTIVSKEVRAKINSDLAYYEGDAKEAYLAEILPRLRAATEIEMPPESARPEPMVKAPEPLPLTNPNLPEITKSPKYIDVLFESVSIGARGYIFRWKENGVQVSLGEPLDRVIDDEIGPFVPIWEVHNSRAEALATLAEWRKADIHTSYFTFYRLKEGVIVPTSYSIASMPHFYKMFSQAERQKAAETREDLIQSLVVIGNAVNPIPFTSLDEKGDLTLNARPEDVLRLLHLARLRRGLGEAGPTAQRIHSGAGVRYRVIGPIDHLSGTSTYVLRDAQGTVLYVGKGETLDRLRSHISDPLKTQWFGEIAEVEVRGTGLNNTEALALEEHLIAELEPLHNVDKRPFYKEFGDSLELSVNLPKTQRILRFAVEWFH